MNPDKLYDYLDGNLPPNERDEIEQRLATDEKLQRQLTTARGIHRGMQRSREQADARTPTDQQRAGRFGRKVATVAAALVLANVVIGIVFIIGHGRTNKSVAPAQDAAIRRQLSASLRQRADAVLPPPTLGDEIELSAIPSERNAVADKVIAAATQCGGSGAKALPNESSATVIVELPGNREREFREALSPLGEISAPAVPSGPVPEKKLLQVQIRDRTVPQKQ